MNALTLRWVNATKAAVESLQATYSTNRGLLLSEGDLECHLFHELLNQPELSGLYHSQNPQYFQRQLHIPLVNNRPKTTMVHSQVTWFKPDKQSGYEVDLTICDPQKLIVEHQVLLEELPNKGFIYDGECVAIELKFIRDVSKASLLAHEDYLKFRDKLIPAKLQNIENENYTISTADNIAFITVVGCKDKVSFDKAKIYLGKHLETVGKPCPTNLVVCLFYQDEMIWARKNVSMHINVTQNLLPKGESLQRYRDEDIIGSSIKGSN